MVGKSLAKNILDKLSDEQVRNLLQTLSLNLKDQMREDASFIVDYDLTGANKKLFYRNLRWLDANGVKAVRLTESVVKLGSLRDTVLVCALVENCFGKHNASLAFGIDLKEILTRLKIRRFMRRSRERERIKYLDKELEP